MRSIHFDRLGMRRRLNRIMSDVTVGRGGAVLRAIFVTILLAFALQAGQAHAEWQPGGNTVAALDFVAQFNPRPITDGHGGAFICYEGGSAAYGPHLQRLARDGQPAAGWSTHAKLSIYDPSIHGVSRPARVLSDGTGGCYVIWLQESENCLHSCQHEPGRIHMQRFAAGGKIAEAGPSKASSYQRVWAIHWGSKSLPMVNMACGWHGGATVPGATHRATRNRLAAKDESRAMRSDWRSHQLTGDGLGGAYVFGPMAKAR
jgi:hypothetical protein